MSALHHHWDRLSDWLWVRPWWYATAISALFSPAVVTLPRPWSTLALSIQILAVVSWFFAYLHGSNRWLGCASCKARR